MSVTLRAENVRLREALTTAEAIITEHMALPLLSEEEVADIWGAIADRLDERRALRIRLNAIIEDRTRSPDKLDAAFSRSAK